MRRLMARPGRVGAAVALAASWLAGQGVSAQGRDDLTGLSGQQLYAAACANCHGPDGRGLDRALVGFEETLPDFTDCDFAAREPSADWIAIAGHGGPARAFSQMMPAFEGALTLEQIESVVAHVRSFCTNPSWPRGELNLPRGLVTEKAFPEDEWVIEAGASLEGDGSVDGQFVYEQRFGPRSMFEVAIPYGWAELPDAQAPGATQWGSGFGDVAIAIKHAAYHSIESGTIFSVGAELVLPTGDEAKGFGGDGVKTEPFLALGQVLPADAFVQLQLGGEVPLYDGGENEGFGRVAVGRTFTAGRWGRSWTPMLELQGSKELEGGAVALDLVPQLQVSLSTRQHVLFNVGALVPTTETTGRSARLVAYLLLDWFDGGFFEGW